MVQVHRYYAESLALAARTTAVLEEQGEGDSRVIRCKGRGCSIVSRLLDAPQSGIGGGRRGVSEEEESKVKRTLQTKSVRGEPPLQLEPGMQMTGRERREHETSQIARRMKI